MEKSLVWSFSSWWWVASAPFARLLYIFSRFIRFVTTFFSIFYYVSVSPALTHNSLLFEVDQHEVNLLQHLKAIPRFWGCQGLRLGLTVKVNAKMKVENAKLAFLKRLT